MVCGAGELVQELSPEENRRGKKVSLALGAGGKQWRVYSQSLVIRLRFLIFDICPRVLFFNKW